MVRLEGTQEGKTFAERMGLLLDYIEPFKQIWPYYWLKAAAIRDPRSSLWLLCYFGLSGRWSDTKPIKPIYDKGNAILAVSKPIDADEAWEILVSLRQNETLQLSPDVIAVAKPEPDITFPRSTWQARVTSQEMPNVVADVAESVDWRYLYQFENITRPISGVLSTDEDRYTFDNRIRSAVQDDLDERSLIDFGSFGATRLGFAYGGEGPNCSITDFLYQFDLPLALRVERGVPDRQNNSLPLTIYCRVHHQARQVAHRREHDHIPRRQPHPGRHRNRPGPIVAHRHDPRVRVQGLHHQRPVDELRAERNLRARYSYCRLSRKCHVETSSITKPNSNPGGALPPR